MIVITSLYGNPLHEGHVEYLEAAFSEGATRVKTISHASLLNITIVNNDKQVKLKNNLPLLNEMTRFKIVKSLWCVDRAILSIDNDKTVCETIRDIRNQYPNKTIIFCNSGDRTPNNNSKETKLCKELGIEKVYLDLPKINSSSEILDNAFKEWQIRSDTKEKN